MNQREIRSEKPEKIQPPDELERTTARWSRKNDELMSQTERRPDESERTTLKTAAPAAAMSVNAVVSLVSRPPHQLYHWSGALSYWLSSRRPQANDNKSRKVMVIYTCIFLTIKVKKYFFVTVNLANANICVINRGIISHS